MQNWAEMGTSAAVRILERLGTKFFRHHVSKFCDAMMHYFHYFDFVTRIYFSVLLSCNCLNKIGRLYKIR